MLKIHHDILAILKSAKPKGLFSGAVRAELLKIGYAPGEQTCVDRRMRELYTWGHVTKLRVGPVVEYFG